MICVSCVLKNAGVVGLAQPEGHCQVIHPRSPRQHEAWGTEGLAP